MAPFLIADGGEETISANSGQAQRKHGRLCLGLGLKDWGGEACKAYERKPRARQVGEKERPMSHEDARVPSRR